MIAIVVAKLFICVMTSSTHAQMVMEKPEDRSPSSYTNTSSGPISENHDEKKKPEKIEKIFPMMLASICNVFDTRAPCQCKEILTNQIATEDGGKKVILEFPEYVCDIKENERREREGKIPQHHGCEQLTAKKMLFRDQEDEPIEIRISYRAGCELRCYSDNCDDHLITNGESVKASSAGKVETVVGNLTSLLVKIYREKSERKLGVSDFCLAYSGLSKSFCEKIVNYKI